MLWDAACKLQNSCLKGKKICLLSPREGASVMKEGHGAKRDV